MSEDLDKSMRHLRRAMKKAAEEGDQSLSSRESANLNLNMYECLWALYKDLGGTESEDSNN